MVDATKKDTTSSTAEAFDATLRSPGKGWIQTFTGRAFKPLSPEQSQINIRDIAHALAYICRFTGHTKRHVSVAEHSVNVSYEVYSPHALEGLLHDASEAYINDIARPLKAQPEFDAYREIEDRISRHVSKVYCLKWPLPEDVKRADMAVLLAEKRDMMGPSPADWSVPGEASLKRIRGLHAEDAEDLFLNRYNELMRLPYHGPFIMRLRQIGRAFRRLVRDCFS